MYTYLLLLRILHIVCGVFWSGTALLMVFYIIPAVEKAGPEGGKILQAITGTNRFPQTMAWLATITVVTGFLLLWHLSSGFIPEWFASKYGMSLSIGGLTALIAFLQVIFINLPAINRSQAIGKTVASKGGIPSDDERNELFKIRNKVFFSTRLIALWLLITIITMAGARYF
jgi:uncharacterized membrane protein